MGVFSHVLKYTAAFAPVLACKTPYDAFGWAVLSVIAPANDDSTEGNKHVCTLFVVPFNTVVYALAL